MTINGVKPVGDDQKWKREVEKELEQLRRLVEILTRNERNR